MNIQAVIPLQSHDAFANPTDGNEPHTLPCPSRLSGNSLSRKLLQIGTESAFPLFYSITRMSYNLFNQSPAVKHLGCFQSFAFTKAAMIILVGGSFCLGGSAR